MNLYDCFKKPNNKSTFSFFLQKLIDWLSETEQKHKYLKKRIFSSIYQI